MKKSIIFTLLLIFTFILVSCTNNPTKSAIIRRSASNDYYNSISSFLDGLEDDQNVYFTYRLDIYKSNNFGAITNYYISDKVDYKYNKSVEFLHYTSYKTRDFDYDKNYYIFKGVDNLLKVDYMSDSLYPSVYDSEYNLKNLIPESFQLESFYDLKDSITNVTKEENYKFVVQIDLKEFLDDEALEVIDYNGVDSEEIEFDLDVYFEPGVIHLRDSNTNQIYVDGGLITVDISAYVMVDSSTPYSINNFIDVTLSDKEETAPLFNGESIVDCNVSVGENIIAYYLEPGFYELDDDYNRFGNKLVYDEEFNVLIKSDYPGIYYNSYFVIDEAQIVYVKFTDYFENNASYEFGLRRLFDVTSPNIITENISLETNTYICETESSTAFREFAFERPNEGGYFTINILSAQKLEESDIGYYYLTSLYHYASINVFEDESYTFYVGPNEEVRLYFYGKFAVRIEFSISFTPDPEED